MTITTNVATKVAAVATGLTMAVSMLAAAPMAHASALTASQVSAIISLLQSFGADAATISNVQASLTGGAPVSGPGSGSTACAFSRDLTIGSQGADVTCLQQALIAAGFSIPAGATGYFGTQTRAAVASWQSSKNIAPAVGYFGPISRGAFNLGGGNGNPGGPITGNGLKVMLASDSPNGTALVQGQASAELAKFTFQNPTGSAVNVTNISFKRFGVSNDATMTNVYLYNGAARLTDSASVSSGAFSFNNPTGLFSVPAGGWITVSVRSDIDASAAGQQIGVQLVSVAATGTLDSSVSLPIMGGLQAVSAATLANVDLAITSSPSATAVDPQADYTVWQNTVTVGTRAVMFKALALRQIGSAQAGDITNYRLYVDGNRVGNAVAAKDANDIITFDLSASPLRLETGGRVIKVVADIVSGASRTFQLSLRYAGDAIFIDTDLNQPILVRGNGSSITAAFAAHTAPATAATINSVTQSAPSISRSADSPTANVSVGASNVKWASFKIIANGEPVKIDNLNVSADTSASALGLDNGKVFLNGVQVGSTKDLAEYGGTTTNFTFGSSFIVPLGQTAVVDIYGDAKTGTSVNLANNETVKIYLGVGASNAQGQISVAAINVPASELTGNQITVSSAALTATKASYYGNQTIIAGAIQAKIGALTLSTGSTEGANVNTIEIGFASAVGSTLTNLTLKNHDTGAMYGTAKSTVGTSNGFTGSVDIPASGTVTFDVYADVKTGANIGAIPATTVTTNTTGTGAITGTSVSVAALGVPTLQTMTVGAATLTVTDNTGSTPDSTNVIAGSQSVKAGVFRFTTQYSQYTIDKLEVIIPSNQATSVANVTIKYLDVNGAQKTATQSLALPTTKTFATATFTGLSFFIPQDNSRDLEVDVSVPTVSSGATSGRGITVGLSANEGFNATDSSGTADTSLTASANLFSNDTGGKGVFYVRKSIASVAAGPAPSSTLGIGTDQVLGRFTVTADAAGDVDWGQVIFSITKSAAITLGATSTVALWDITGGATNVLGTFATTTSAAQAQCATVCDTFGVATPSSTGGSLHFRPNTAQTVPMGTTRTYELRGTVGGTLTSGVYNVNVSLGNPSTTATANNTFLTLAGTYGTSGNASFVWSDWASPTAHAADAGSLAGSATDWTNDFLVKTLPVTLGSRSLQN